LARERRVGGIEGTLIKEAFAKVGGLRAGENFQKRGFAGAVFAEQCVNFAALNDELNAVQGLDARELLVDVANLENGTGHVQ